MTYSYYDRLLDFEPGARAIATKSATFSEDYLATHFPRFPVLPAAMMIDAVIALGSELIADEKRRPVFAHMIGIEGAKFSRFVRPGDQVRICVQIARWNYDSQEAFLTAELKVGAEIIARIRRLILSWRDRSPND